MIDVASRATNGVKIPGRKATRAKIKRTFKKHLTELKSRLNVRAFLEFCCSHGTYAFKLQGPTVTGEVNVTCDAWQASNTDGYFAVTGHWIEETAPREWELKSGLLGFTRVSNSHNGQRLGQALFKIFKRVGIEHKVC